MKNSLILSSLLILAFFTALAYLPFIPFLGFYSEDFFFSYVGHFYGPEGLIKSNAVDRPFDGYLMSWGYSILGDNVFAWHISTFLLRFFSSLILFYALKNIWPKRLQIVTLITLFFSIYPGFLQQTLPLGYQVYPLGLIFWNSSLLFTILAIKSKKIYIVFFTIISIVLQILSFANLEFFIGMEALRILLIVYLLNGNSIGFSLFISKKTLRSWRHWIPYILCLTIFVLWRIFIFNSTRDITSISWVIQTYYSDLSWVFKIPLEIFFSFSSAVILAFFIPIVINIVRLPPEVSVILVLTGFISSSFLYLYLKKIPLPEADAKFGKQLFFIGVIGALAAIFPIIIAGRQIRLFNVLDRYTVSSIVSAAFILTGLSLFKFRQFFKPLMALLIALSITSHLMNAYWHKIMWEKQNNLWWQIYWRAPKIEDGSMIIFNFPKLSENNLLNKLANKLEWQRFYWAEEQIWSEGNLFLNYNNPPEKHFHGDLLADIGIAEKIKQGDLETMNNRNIIYTRDFTRSIIINAPSDVSCLKILSGDDLIKQGPPNPPPLQIFGREPKPDWCYFFQKASLAKQLKDWDQLAKLKKEVIKKNLKPRDPGEWLVFDTKLR